MNPIRVLIVDDSAVVREMITSVLAADPKIRVIGAAPDPIFAMERMSREWPDVIVLDIEMPRMDGLTFLRKIMSERPTPVVMCSTLSQKGADVSLRALSYGAIACVGKPKDVRSRFREDAAGDLITQVKAAALARFRGPPRPIEPDKQPQPAVAAPGLRSLVPAVPVAKKVGRPTNQGHIIAIGASTGGTQALEAVLTRLPENAPPIVIVQHMPEHFTAAFAKRLNGLCAIEVLEARNGEEIVSGRALIAPGGKQMSVRRSGLGFAVEVMNGPYINRHRPSVDFLFRSVAANVGAKAVGIIMTGMGNDGAAGLLKIHQAGGITIGQNEISCVVYGMPKEAFRMGAVQTEVDLSRIPDEIQSFIR